MPTTGAVESEPQNTSKLNAHQLTDNEQPLNIKDLDLALSALKLRHTLGYALMTSSMIKATRYTTHSTSA